MTTHTGQEVPVTDPASGTDISMTDLTACLSALADAAELLLQLYLST